MSAAAEGAVENFIGARERVQYFIYENGGMVGRIPPAPVRVV